MQEITKEVEEIVEIVRKTEEFGYMKLNVKIVELTVFNLEENL